MKTKRSDEQVRWPPDVYQLVDFGDGRKLERFGDVLLDRPCPAATGRPADKGLWGRADAVVSKEGHVRWVTSKRDSWRLAIGKLRFVLKLTPFGHVGLFPEQLHNWNWLAAYSGRRRSLDQSLHVINLFAYTGGSSLAASNKQTNVTHVDASAPAVNWARVNATESGMQGASIRWIVEDARKYVARELRRKRRYDCIVLDPPSFGHGPKGKRWDLAADLPPLFGDCVALMRDAQQSRMLFTGHSSEPGLDDMVELVEQFRFAAVRFGRLQLESVSGRLLDCGYYLRVNDDAS